MKFSTIPCLLAALCSTTHVLANAVQEPATAITEAPAATPTPELVDNEPQPHLEPRQGAVVANPAASINPEQYPIATTQWIESTIGDSTTYISVAYTQTFASVPDQWVTAGTGTIGYGTLTKNGKRDVPAVETDYTDTFAVVVLELRNELVTQYVQPVTEILILHTVTVLANASNATVSGAGGYNYTYPSFNGTTFGGNGTANGSMVNTTVSGDTAALAAASAGAVAYNYSSGTGTGTRGSGSGFHFF
ncbi:hypothetical protein B0A55_03437 [Friedmanniomyces simplex]|uniref:Uncharacterized protein n=1 Tax=Friedmanniomyces simplex TaxID=329884 RepID=A0A4U0XT56_9PEZI|nr:hypothetical protein B0A55_03437 [Friedmanniomyces simplex]